MTSDPLAPVRAEFRALTEAFVPEAAACSPEQWTRADAIVAHALGRRPPAMQRQVVLFIRILNLLARLRWGRGLSRLDRARRTALLERIGAAPVLLLRRGVWGLRTLAMMGYYTRQDTLDALGYRATAAGWEARR